MPRYVEEQFIAAARDVGLRVEPRADGLWRVEHVLADLRSDRLAIRAEAGQGRVELPQAHVPQGPPRTERPYRRHPDRPRTPALRGRGREAQRPARAAHRRRRPSTSTRWRRRPIGSTSSRSPSGARTRRGEDVPLFGELVAVREEEGEFEKVPSDLLLNLPPHPSPPATIEQTNPLPAADFLKSTYQLECRAECQQEREQFSSICRDYLTKSFKARIDKAQERAMSLGATGQHEPRVQARLRRGVQGRHRPGARPDRPPGGPRPPRDRPDRPGQARRDGRGPDPRRRRGEAAWHVRHRDRRRTPPQEGEEGGGDHHRVARGRGIPAREHRACREPAWAWVRHPRPPGHRQGERGHRRAPDRGQRLHPRERRSSWKSPSGTRRTSFARPTGSTSSGTPCRPARSPSESRTRRPGSNTPRKRSSRNAST